MKPHIDGSEFGSIIVEGEPLDHDIVIRLSDKVEKRNKKLSKQHYGTSHRLPMDEAKHVFDDGAKRLIVGTGQNAPVRLSDEAAAYFCKHGGCVELHSIPAAIDEWNDAQGRVIGWFHVTC